MVGAPHGVSPTKPAVTAAPIPASVGGSPRTQRQIHTLWPPNRNARMLSVKFQIITTPSAPPEASCLPLWLYEEAKTLSRCPRKVLRTPTTMPMACHCRASGSALIRTLPVLGPWGRLSRLPWWWLEALLWGKMALRSSLSQARTQHRNSRQDKRILWCAAQGLIVGGRSEVICMFEGSA